MPLPYLRALHQHSRTRDAREPNIRFWFSIVDSRRAAESAYRAAPQRSRIRRQTEPLPFEEAS